MSSDFQAYFQQTLTDFEAYLRQAFPELPTEVQRLREAVLYSLLAGGKRLRPVLLLTVLNAAGIEQAQGYPFAAAIEFIHTYSLIHDDLPCMDNDDMRRGKPTNHIVFGEEMALLAGDSLLTEAFRLISTPNAQQVPPEQTLRAIHCLASKAGNFGMVSGQVADILAEKGQNSYELLQFIHLHKTGMLITASLEIGGILAGLEATQQEWLVRFGMEIGKCFQIQDDILDETASTEALGKPAGSDIRNQKLTYPSLFGLEEAKRLAEESYQLALSHLEKTGLKTGYLKGLADFVLKRDH